MSAKKTSIGVALLVGLAACAQAGKDAPVVKVAAKSVDQPAARRLVETSVVAQAGGQSLPARCTLDSPYYAATFTAPARVMLPDYGINTPPVQVACATDDVQGAVEVAPTSDGQRAATTAGVLLFGVVGAIAANAMAAENDSDHFYNPIVVRMK